MVLHLPELCDRRRRQAQLEESVARYLSQLETAGRQEPTEALAAKATRLKQKLAKLEEEMAKLAAYEKQMLASSDQQISSPIPTVARWRRAGADRHRRLQRSGGS